MPQIKSAIKRVITSDKANKRNASDLSKLRTQVRKFKEAVADNVNDLHIEAARALDKAASKGLISKNKANRDKSRLTKKVAK
ncbi:MAG: 30S ribosomal protein S20 [Lactobacillus iners]|nr:30S ribosomal protein S20 [Lactobacillus iners]